MRKIVIMAVSIVSFAPLLSQEVACQELRHHFAEKKLFSQDFKRTFSFGAVSSTLLQFVVDSILHYKEEKLLRRLLSTPQKAELVAQLAAIRKKRRYLSRMTGAFSGAMYAALLANFAYENHYSEVSSYILAVVLGQILAHGITNPVASGLAKNLHALVTGNKPLVAINDNGKATIAV